MASRQRAPQRSPRGVAAARGRKAPGGAPAASRHPSAGRTARQSLLASFVPQPAAERHAGVGGLGH
eukprot:498581-Prymnesium_polylepis.1